MSVLDQRDRWMAIDPKLMIALIEGFPEQVEAAAAAGRNISLELPRDMHAIVLTGLGGSAIGGDLVRCAAGPHLRVPVIINRDYDLPAFVDGHSLVFASSYSGNTEETLSAYEQARQRRAPVVCITSGGRLAELAKLDGYPVLLLPGGLPPRAALGYSMFMLLGALQALQIVPDMTEPIRETVGLLKKLSGRYGSINPESANTAKKLAHSLHGKIISIYGSSGILDAAAFRWRSQIAENSKNLAFHHVLPEMNHNELVGWRYPEDVLRMVGVVLLRDKGDHPQVQRRFELTRELIADRAGVLHEVWSEGESLLARVMSILYLGDFVSLYLAYLNSVDPMPVQVIDYLKQKLSVPR